MKFARLVTVQLTPAAAGHIPFTLEGGNTHLAEIPLKVNQGKDRTSQMLVGATTTLSVVPVPDEAGYIRVPEIERRECETVIEYYANLVSIRHRVARTLSSPEPPALLIAEDQAERDILASLAGIKVNSTRRMHPIPRFEPDDKVLAGLNDRSDGVALFGEALSTTPLGKFRDYIRLFELAFACDRDALAKGLTAFLSPLGMGYTRREINAWLSKRDAASHADLQRSTEFVLEGDVVDYVNRMEQAAFEVLMNKKNWHDRSAEYRRLVVADVFTTSSDNIAYTVTRDRAMDVQAQILDDFAAYPRNLAATLKIPEEQGYWKRAGGNTVLAGPINVIDPSPSAP